tara:strand:+ start:435 stop:845 length:411 start_codon:yes stop_codon:yes gene_type:complete
MKFSNLFDSNAFFRAEKDIKSCIKNSKNYEEEDPMSTNLLLIFSTSKQRTYLVASSKRLYCILDDIRKDVPRINWSLRRNSLKSNGQIIINILSRDKTEKTGLVDIGSNHKNWLFSKKLFERLDIVSSIKNLISAM